MVSHLIYVFFPLQSNLKGGARLVGEEMNRVTLIFGVLFVMYILLKVWFLLLVWMCVWWLTVELSECVKIFTDNDTSHTLPVICIHSHSHLHIFMFEAAVLLALKCLFSSVSGCLTDTRRVFFSYTAVWKQKSNVRETGKVEQGGARTYS